MWREKFPAISRLEDNKRCAPIGWISYMAVAGLAIWHRHEHRPHAGPDRAAILGDPRAHPAEAEASEALTGGSGPSSTVDEARRALPACFMFRTAYVESELC